MRITLHTLKDPWLLIAVGLAAISLSSALALVLFFGCQWLWRRFPCAGRFDGWLDG